MAAFCLRCRLRDGSKLTEDFEMAAKKKLKSAKVIKASKLLRLASNHNEVVLRG